LQPEFLRTSTRGIPHFNPSFSALQPESISVKPLRYKDLRPFRDVPSILESSRVLSDIISTIGRVGSEREPPPIGECCCCNLISSNARIHRTTRRPGTRAEEAQRESVPLAPRSSYSTESSDSPPRRRRAPDSPHPHREEPGLPRL